MTNACEKIFMKLKKEIIDDEEKQVEFKEQRQIRIKELIAGNKNLNLILNKDVILENLRRAEESKTLAVEELKTAQDNFQKRNDKNEIALKE